MTEARRNYQVEGRAFQWGQWTEWKDEGVYFAKDASDAKSQARAMARRNGWMRQDGKLEFRAKLAGE